MNPKDLQLSKPPEITVLVTEQELLAHKVQLQGQTILSILKERGAPVNGTFYLEIDPSYITVQHYNFEMRARVFEFYKKV